MLFCCSPPIFHYFIAHALLPYSGPCTNVVFVAPVLWVQRPNMWVKARTMAELKSCLVTVFVLLFKCNKLYKFIIRYKRTEEWNSAHKVHMLLALQLSVGTHIQLLAAECQMCLFVCLCVYLYNPKNSVNALKIVRSTEPQQIDKNIQMAEWKCIIIIIGWKSIWRMQFCLSLNKIREQEVKQRDR